MNIYFMYLLFYFHFNYEDVTFFFFFQKYLPRKSKNNFFDQK